LLLNDSGGLSALLLSGTLGLFNTDFISDSVADSLWNLLDKVGALLFSGCGTLLLRNLDDSVDTFLLSGGGTLSSRFLRNLDDSVDTFLLSGGGTLFSGLSSCLWHTHGGTGLFSDGGTS